MRISELIRNRGVVVGIATTPRRQHCQCGLVSLLTCHELLHCRPLNNVGAM